MGLNLSSTLDLTSWNGKPNRLHVSWAKTIDAEKTSRESVIAKLSKTFGDAFANDKQLATAA